MKILFTSILFFLFPILLFSQVDYQARAEKNLAYLIRDSILLNQIEMDNEAVRIFASAEDKKNGKAEFIVKWENVQSFLDLLIQGKKIDSLSSIENNKIVHKDFSYVEEEKPNSYKGLRIAIDPGHSANNFKTAILERRYIKMKANDVGLKKDIRFYESDLTWQTAKILAKRLRAKGAEVLITRKKGKNAFGTNFKKWKKSEFHKTLERDLKNKIITQKIYNWYLEEATEKDIYKYMNKKDLIERAKIINDFRADISLIIHYNANGNNVDKDGYLQPISNNYCMAFTGGGFMKNELSSQDARLDFLRLLLSNDLERSIALSGFIMKQHSSIAKVPVTPNKNNLRYLQRNSVYADMDGVYCRNLALSRMVKGAICFGESLMQDNINEAVLLNQKNYKEAGVRTSSRIKLMVDAYEAGIHEYLNQ